MSIQPYYKMFIFSIYHQTYQILCRCSSAVRSKKEVALGFSFVLSRRVKCNYDLYVVSNSYVLLVPPLPPSPPRLFLFCFATGYRLGVAVYYRLWQSHYVFALFQWENITSKQKSATCYLTHSISAILHSFFFVKSISRKKYLCTCFRIPKEFKSNFTI